MNPTDELYYALEEFGGKATLIEFSILIVCLIALYLYLIIRRNNTLKNK